MHCDRTVEVIIQDHRDTRSTQQNRLMWKRLGEVAAQVVWYGEKLSSEEWKDLMSASLKKQTVKAGIDGGFVVCGTSTSKMTIKEMNDMITLTEAFGTSKGVRFSARE